MSEIVGQEHITTALSRALSGGTIGHAYLFTGPRGTGKTSIARILAHEVNGLPYQDETNHLDIIEIDAASNRRIDEIRDLRDKVHIAPTSAKYKVYIIDEVHMLTKEAFNALLKTLEEPPAHVIFILATTEVHKLPETIISRTQRFSFKPVELPRVVDHLKSIAKKENIDITDEALELIAAHGEGSFRDSISLLDQTRNSGEKVTLATVQGLLGIAPEKLITTLLAAVTSHDVPAVARHLQTLQEQGYEPAQVAKQLGQAVRKAIVQEGKVAADESLNLLGKLVEVPASHDPRASLEIALLDAALSGKIDEPKSVAKAMVQANAVVQVEPHPSSILRSQKSASERPQNNASAPTISSNASTDVLDQTAWVGVLDQLKKQHNTLYSVIRSARPSFQPGTVILECEFAFHKKRLSDAHNKKIIIDTVQTITGQQVNILCSLSAAPSNPAATEPSADGVSDKPESDEVAKISNIFGGAELLES